ncbi:MAG: nucleotidyltransferase domain-containing protein, partial [Thermoplasmata archaeon]
MLRQLLSTPWKAVGAPDLAKAIGTSRASVLRRLKTLEGSGVVRRVGDGRKVTFRIDTTSAAVPALFELVELERMTGLPPPVRITLEDFMSGLDRERVHGVILFGSHARGLGREDSDVDVCVVFKGDTIPGGERVELMAKGDVPTLMEVHEYSEDEFAWVPDLPALDALLHGITIHGHRWVLVKRSTLHSIRKELLTRRLAETRDNLAMAMDGDEEERERYSTIVEVSLAEMETVIARGTTISRQEVEPRGDHEWRIRCLEGILARIGDNVW